MLSQLASSGAPSACDAGMRDLRVFWNASRVSSGRPQ
ncbi:Uncharacterised protein [Mycobacteroides abscessus subsp. abscessus]|nr:Uncharacterised protein [Mycobacteroides abscessus subsp. abscessus]